MFVLLFVELSMSYFATLQYLMCKSKERASNSASIFFKTAAETLKMRKQAFGEDALNQTQTYEWYNRFKNGRESVNNDERSGRLSTETQILQDRRRTIFDIYSIVDLSYGVCHSIWRTQYAGYYWEVCAKFTQCLASTNTAVLSAVPSSLVPRSCFL